MNGKIKNHHRPLTTLPRKQDAEAKNNARVECNLHRSRNEFKQLKEEKKRGKKIITRAYSEKQRTHPRKVQRNIQQEDKNKRNTKEMMNHTFSTTTTKKHYTLNA